MKKKLISFILSAAMALSVVAGVVPAVPNQVVSASSHPVWQNHEHTLNEYEVCTSCGIGKCGENAFFEFNSETGALVVFGEGSLKQSAFDSDYHETLSLAIKSVVVEEGITKFEKYAFWGCNNCSSIKLPNTLTYIGMSSFSHVGVNLSEPAVVEIPCSVTYIDSYLSYGENLITYRVAPGSYTENFIKNKMSGFNGTVIVDFPHSENIEKVTTSCGSVMYLGECEYCGLSDLTYENHHVVTSEYVNHEATCDVCGETVNNGTHMATYDSYGICNECHMGDCGPRAHYTFNEETGALVVFGEGRIEKSAFDNASHETISLAIKSVVVEEGITLIDEYAFWGCMDCESVKLPSTLTTIGKGCFECIWDFTIDIPCSVNNLLVEYIDEINDYYTIFGYISRISISESIVINVVPGSAAETYCNTYFAECESITINSTLDHAPVVTDAAVAPTTTSTGLTQGSHCGGCGKVFTAQTVIPSTTPAPTTAPTATPVTPAPTTAPTATPAPTQTASSNQSESGVSGFVERLYTIALNRPSDPNGKADWVNRVYTQGATGADVAQGFLFSPEFLGKDMSNEDFLGVLYRVFFDRVGDQGGIDYWLENMANGMDKQTVIWGFINSTEWANVCLRFGIASGGNGVPNITIEPSAEIIEFATRLYTTCLGRNADQNGLMDWATQLANRQISGSQAAAGFFTSSEFVNANYENDEYINRLYRTFMGREADQGGFDYWMGRFAEGATREDVFNGFAGSQEWAGICSSYGILK